MPAKSLFCAIIGVPLALLAAQTVGASRFRAAPLDADAKVIAVIGDIEPDDGERFATLTAQIPFAVVVFSSRGGNLLAGLRIGSVIRAKGFATAVTDGATCASACAYAWLSGKVRILEPGSHLGFHAAYFDRNGSAEISGGGSALIGAYLRVLNLSYDAIFSLTAPGPNEMRWLDRDGARSLGIETTDFEGIAAQEGRQSSDGAASGRQPISVNTFKASIPRFVSAYFSTTSADNQSAMNFMDSHYASQVNFFGKLTPKATIMAQKLVYVQRWPERLFIPDRNVTVACRGIVCAVSGAIDFETRSSTRGAHSAGRSTFRLTLTLSDADIKIIGEDSKVVLRR